MPKHSPDIEGLQLADESLRTVTVLTEALMQKWER